MTGDALSLRVLRELGDDADLIAATSRKQRTEGRITDDEYRRRMEFVRRARAALERVRRHTESN
jgi:hypothetical protein